MFLLLFFVPDSLSYMLAFAVACPYVIAIAQRGKKSILTGGVLVGFVMVAIVLSSCSKSEALDRKTQIEQEIQSNSETYHAEAPLAARGRIAEQRMAVLNRTNNLLRQELQMLSPKE